LTTERGYETGGGARTDKAQRFWLVGRDLASSDRECRRRKIGATGLVYEARALEILRSLEIETHLVVTKPALLRERDKPKTISAKPAGLNDR
jgi:hypothetical protein